MFLAAVYGAILLTACSVRPVTFTPDNGEPSGGPTTATITINRGGAAMGRVEAQGLPLSCGDTCTATVAVGATVTLVASPDAGAVFGGWTGGGCAGTEATCTVAVAQDVAISARFDVAMFTVEVGLVGSGGGVVMAMSGSLVCPDACTVSVPYNTVLALVATPTAISTFLGWGGACGGTGTCSVTVTGNTSVTAAFAANNDLVVMRAGNGGGTVSSSPAGISCGADCSEKYAPGTMVTLTAAAAGDSTFTGWSGAGCTGTSTCQVTLDQAVLVTATFALQQHTLTVAKAGNGSGTVSSSPAGISCGTDCTESYDAHTVVTLTAVAAADTVFSGWTGAGCSGTGTCVVTMDAAASVTASFTLKQFLLSVAKTGNGSGTVSSSPAGISCGTDCTESYDAGTIVTLTATPDAGVTFAGWSGACSGAGACRVTMAAASSVTVAFSQVSGLMAVASYTGSSIAIFPAGASGDTAPLRVITGTATTLVNPRGVAVVNNEIIVMDQGATAIDVFPVTASGNVAPIRRVTGSATGLSQPAGVLVFGGEIYVGQQNGVLSVFPLTANGNVAPSRTIIGIGETEEMAIAGGELYVADASGGRVLVFPAGATGAAAPTRIIAGAATGINLPVGLRISNGEIFVANASNGQISVFPQLANGNVAPVRVISGANTGLTASYQISIFAGELSVACFTTNSVLVFPVTASGNVAPTRRIIGPNTLLVNPAGVFTF